MDWREPFTGPRFYSLHACNVSRKQRESRERVTLGGVEGLTTPVARILGRGRSVEGTVWVDGSGAVPASPLATASFERGGGESVFADYTGLSTDQGLGATRAKPVTDQEMRTAIAGICWQPRCVFVAQIPQHQVVASRNRFQRIGLCCRDLPKWWLRTEWPSRATYQPGP